MIGRLNQILWYPDTPLVKHLKFAYFDSKNDVSEKEQRWGAKTLDTDLNQFGNGNLTPAELARRAVAAHEQKSKEEADAIR